MSTTVLLEGERLRLDDRALLGTGGEGRVFRARSHGHDVAIKLYFQMTPDRAQKLAAFPTALPARVIAPLAVCTDPRGAVVGYAMRLLENATLAYQLAARKWRDTQPGLDANHVLRLFRELHTTIGTLHARGLVVGDLNDGNVALVPEASGWQPYFIDADSMQLPAHACTVAHERFLDPRLYGVDLTSGAALTADTDWYALAVLLFSSLLLVHPYGGAHASYPTLLRRAEGRHSVLRGDVKLPRAALPPAVLPEDLAHYFAGVFDRGERVPLPATLLDARFVRCSCGAMHGRRSCPVCAVSAPAVPAVRTVGALRARRVAALPSGLVHEGLVRLDGAVLSRTHDGTTIGQVLEGQTHVAASPSLGFAFYRAGLLTMYFLFDTRRGPLRQLTLPPLVGRLVEWHAAFDDAHVLFTARTEHQGHEVRIAHLLDDHGQVLASESGPAGASPILASVTGACLASGAVLTPTEDGLVLVRADRATRRFVPVRTFPGTRELVPPDADLLVGPGGSVYVVTHDEIVHLTFEGNPSP